MSEERKNGEEFIKEQERKREIARLAEEKRIAAEEEKKERDKVEFNLGIVVRNLESAKKNIEIFTEQVAKHQKELIDLEIMKRDLERELGK